MPRFDLTDEERIAIKEKIKELFEELANAGDPELEDILAVSTPMCKDCYFFKPTYESYGECRFKEPPWISLDRLHWCGKWWSEHTTRYESAYRRLLIEAKK